MGIRGGVYPHDEISPSVVATDGTVTESTENKAYIAGPPPRPRRTACDCRPGTHMPRLSPAELQAARRASGNLGGRPRKPTQAEARAAALEELVPAAIKSLAAHLGEGDPDAWRAALRVFELSDGKPAETVETRCRACRPVACRRDDGSGAERVAPRGSSASRISSSWFRSGFSRSWRRPTPSRTTSPQGLPPGRKRAAVGALLEIHQIRRLLEPEATRLATPRLTDEDFSGWRTASAGWRTPTTPRRSSKPTPPSTR